MQAYQRTHFSFSQKKLIFDSMNNESKPPKSEVEAKVTRRTRNYPIGPFEESFLFAKSLYSFGSGAKVRRVAFFGHLNKSPESGPSRMMITNSTKYGLTTGGYSAEFIELTQEGLNAVNEDISDLEQHRAKLTLVFQDIPVFNALYNRFKDGKLPNLTVIADILRSDIKMVNEEDINPVVDLFVVNAKYLQLLQVISGAERMISIEHCLDGYQQSNSKRTARAILKGDAVSVNDVNGTQTEINKLQDLCFYITPIGEEGSLERRHSDLFLGSIVEPALDTMNIKVVRADQIDKPGTITKQIIEYLSKAKLVIADLSFNNPNVFYELAIRHAFRLPTVHLIKKGDKIPFDVSSSRTIIIDNTDIYSLIPNIETYKSQISSQVRQVLEDPDAVDNPLTAVYPNIRLSI